MRNKLLAGRLQLSDQTYVVVDETVLQAGTLNETGRRIDCAAEKKEDSIPGIMW